MAEQPNEIEVEYPHFSNNALSIFVFCAFEENRHSAAQAFKRMCPRIFNVEEIRPVQSKRKPHCRWEVDFQLTDGSYLPPPGPNLKKLFKYLTTLCPTDAEVMRRRASTPQCVTVIYKVKCDCKPSDLNLALKNALTWEIEGETLKSLFPALEITAESKEECYM